jgi:hypothetical protein
MKELSEWELHEKELKLWDQYQENWENKYLTGSLFWVYYGHYKRRLLIYFNKWGSNS